MPDTTDNPNPETNLETDQTPERASYVQASFRLTPQTLQTIRQIATNRGISQSEAMRQAASLLSHLNDLPDDVKLATVDINDHTGADHYRVLSWLLID